MSFLRSTLPCLLGLLHATAVVVLGGTSPYPTVALVTTIGSTNPGSTDTLQMRTDASATPEGDSGPEVEPILSLHCLEDGRMLLICESGHQGAIAFRWTLDENYLQETLATITYNNNTIIFERGVHGNMMCKVRGHSKDFVSSPIKLACKEDTSSSWLFYSIILAASGGGAFLLSMVVLSITCCCCRRRSRHFSLDQEDIEMGSVFVDLEKKLNAEEVNAVEETTSVTNKASPKPAPEEDGFKFPNPPGQNHLLSEGDGNDATEKRPGSCAAGSGSDGSKDEDPVEKMTEEESTGCLEN
ncbi:uncharacterized protein LOC144771457 [Lissotriton helveticus]